jgi:curli biogenesis system outer membrane secretion channel CsgG
MRSIKASVTGAVLVLLFGIAAQAQESGHKPVIGVRTFENPPNYYNSTVGTGLTDLFITRLMKTGRYRIVERDGIDDLIDEIELSQSNYGEKESIARKGHFKGLEYLFIAKVSNFGDTQRSLGTEAFSYPTVFGSLGVRKSEAYVRIDFRIVDAITREIVYSGYGEGLDKTKGIRVSGGGYGSGGAIDVSSQSFLESQIGRATIKAIEQAIQTMDNNLLGRGTSGAAALSRKEQANSQSLQMSLASAPGKILAVASGKVAIVSLGRRNGIRDGETLNVFEVKHIRDSRGSIVYTDERPIGLLRVTEVKEDRSKAIQIGGDALAEGYVVRRQ